MLTVNIDIQDRLTNAQTGNINYLEFAQGSVQKVYVKFSGEQAGLKAMRSSYLVRKNYQVPTEICEAKIPIKKESASSSIKRTEFPSIIAWTSTFHKFQGLSLQKVVFHFDLRKQKPIKMHCLSMSD